MKLILFDNNVKNTGIVFGKDIFRNYRAENIFEIKKNLVIPWYFGLVAMLRIFGIRYLLLKCCLMSFIPIGLTAVSIYFP